MPTTFRSEDDMRQQVLGFLSSELGEDWVSVAECMSAWGVPDIVFVRVNQSALSSRRGTGLAALPEYSLCSVVAALEDSPADLDSLVRRTGYSADYLRYRLLKRLIGEGYVEYLQSDLSYRLNPSFLSPSEEMVAIEMKVSQWERAWFQAWRYLGFAERSYIAMGLAGPICESVTASMAKSDVGVIFVSPEGARIAKEAEYRGPTRRVDRIFVGEVALSLLTEDAGPDRQVLWHHCFRGNGPKSPPEL